MNSLSVVKRFTTTPPATPPRSRTASSANVGTLSSNGDNDTSTLDFASLDEKLSQSVDDDVKQAAHKDEQSQAEYVSEKTPLLSSGDSGAAREEAGRGWKLPRRIAAAVFYGVQVVFSTITAPGRYVIACFYDEQGHFSAILPLRKFKNIMTRRKQRSTAQAVGLGGAQDSSEEEQSRPQKRGASRRSPSVDSTASTATAGSSASDEEHAPDSPARHTRSKTGAQSQVPGEKRRSIRMKEPQDEALRKRKASKAKRAANSEVPADVANTLKSPSSPSNPLKMTRYPRAPATPRPLVPRRQPSYTLAYSPDTPKKTLIIDLDETLIHSMAKGGRMSTGHMVEVRLMGQVSSSGVQIGPGVPILYYVHERPGCHEFLRKVRKWYNLIVFTASVQEYADPVIDWLERETKYFSGRYYRQHCTFRNGAYIKDLAQVEPDLSKVMILDNSPMSYIFHEGKSAQCQ